MTSMSVFYWKDNFYIEYTNNNLNTSWTVFMVDWHCNIWWYRSIYCLGRNQILEWLEKQQSILLPIYRNNNVLLFNTKHCFESNHKNICSIANDERLEFISQKVKQYQKQSNRISLNLGKQTILLRLVFIFLDISFIWSTPFWCVKSFECVL